MKTHQLLLFLLLMLLFPPGKIKAQIPAIDSLKIIPAFPSIADSVKVICYTTFPNGDCKLSSSSLSVNGNIINVFASHKLGIAAYICHSKDTLLLGKFDTGTFQLYYHLFDTIPPVTHDIDTINFTVSNTVGIPAHQPAENLIHIYPNPATTEVFIDLKVIPKENFKIEIISVYGQILKSVNYVNEKTAIDIHNLAEGVYFIIISNDNKQNMIHKFFKSAR